ncbi:MAG: 3-dehydroquinate dehydratase [Geminicoccaceae bacterium]|nr:3-dehydroquinate dehydratase [Geminicoccaceae bacterium]MCB9969563.1 3-dehydroquinate dehydratase [Geminicoccaceae bacterium]HRY26587.1 type II 3-dehydroquinate dehydratase [Geminicoccaceae bacterium]
MTRLLVLQGANMNWLGRRQPEIYGRTTAAELDTLLRAHAAEHGYEIEIVYKNHEGDAIDALYAAEAGDVDAVVLNPGGFSYAGYALRDCIKGIELPVIEIHLSNHYARNIHSVTAEAARGVFMGLGIGTYIAGLEAALRLARRG